MSTKPETNRFEIKSLILKEGVKLIIYFSDFLAIFKELAMKLQSEKGQGSEESLKSYTSIVNLFLAEALSKSNIYLKTDLKTKLTDPESLNSTNSSISQIQDPEKNVKDMENLFSEKTRKLVSEIKKLLEIGQEKRSPQPQKVPEKKRLFEIASEFDSTIQKKEQSSIDGGSIFLPNRSKNRAGLLQNQGVEVKANPEKQNKTSPIFQGEIPEEKEENSFPPKIEGERVQRGNATILMKNLDVFVEKIPAGPKESSRKADPSPLLLPQKDHFQKKLVLEAPNPEDHKVIPFKKVESSAWKSDTEPDLQVDSWVSNPLAADSSFMIEFQRIKIDKKLQKFTLANSFKLLGSPKKTNRMLLAVPRNPNQQPKAAVFRKIIKVPCTGWLDEGFQEINCDFAVHYELLGDSNQTIIGLKPKTKISTAEEKNRKNQCFEYSIFVNNKQGTNHWSKHVETTSQEDQQDLGKFIRKNKNTDIALYQKRSQMVIVIGEVKENHLKFVDYYYKIHRLDTIWKRLGMAEESHLASKGSPEGLQIRSVWSKSYKNLQNEIIDFCLLKELKVVLLTRSCRLVLLDPKYFRGEYPCEGEQSLLLNTDSIYQENYIATKLATDADMRYVGMAKLHLETLTPILEVYSVSRRSGRVRLLDTYAERDLRDLRGGQKENIDEMNFESINQNSSRLRRSDKARRDDNGLELRQNSRNLSSFENKKNHRFRPRLRPGFDGEYMKKRDHGFQVVDMGLKSQDGDIIISLFNSTNQQIVLLRLDTSKKQLRFIKRLDKLKVCGSGVPKFVPTTGSAGEMLLLVQFSSGQVYRVEITDS